MHTFASSSAGPCRTAHAQLLGAAGYSPALFTNVAQNYTVPHRPGAIDTRVAKHLAGAVPTTCGHNCHNIRSANEAAEETALHPLSHNHSAGIASCTCPPADCREVV